MYVIPSKFYGKGGSVYYVHKNFHQINKVSEISLSSHKFYTKPHSWAVSWAI